MKINLSLRPALLAAALSLSLSARAGNDLYFVTYNHEIAKGEFEVMLMNDYTSPSDFKRLNDGEHNYFSQMLELEYGVTEQYATELMFEGFAEPTTGKGDFTGFRWENRYRIFREEVPLNPMLYMEYEDLDPKTRFKMETSGWINPPYLSKAATPDRERVMETRLVLSQDFGRLNAAFNWINETDLNESGFTAFGYSLGLRYNFDGGHYAHHEREETEHQGKSCHAKSGEEGHEGHFALGLELYGGLGDMQRFGLEPSRQEHYLQPVFMWHINERLMLHIGVAMGLSKTSDNLVRTALAFEF